MTNELTTTNGRAATVITERPLDQNPAAVYIAGLGKGSRRTMETALNRIAEILGIPRTENQEGRDVRYLFCNWAALRFQHTAAIRTKLQETPAKRGPNKDRPLAIGTVNKDLIALRGVLKEAWRLGQMPAEDYHRAADLKRVGGEPLPTGRNLTPGEIEAMFRVCANDPTPAGARDAALLALLRLGLRRQEIARLELADYDQEGEAVKVRGKGNKERLTPLMNGAAAAVRDWLALRGDDPGPLLLAVNKGGRITGDGISPQAVYNILHKRAEQANVSDLSPHDWRRTFAGDLLDAGADLSVVQKLMGHSSPTTTARYDRRPEAAKRKAVNLLHVPYQRRGLGV